MLLKLSSRTKGLAQIKKLPKLLTRSMTRFLISLFWIHLRINLVSIKAFMCFFIDNRRLMAQYELDYGVCRSASLK